MATRSPRTRTQPAAAAQPTDLEPTTPQAPALEPTPAPATPISLEATPTAAEPPALTPTPAAEAFDETHLMPAAEREALRLAALARGEQRAATLTEIKAKFFPRIPEGDAAAAKLPPATLLTQNLFNYLNAEHRFNCGLEDLRKDHPEIFAKYLGCADEFEAARTNLGTPLRGLTAIRSTSTIKEACANLLEIVKAGGMAGIPPSEELDAVTNAVNNLLISKLSPVWGTLSGQMTLMTANAKLMQGLMASQAETVELAKSLARIQGLQVEVAFPEVTEVYNWASQLEAAGVTVTPPASAAATPAAPASA